MFKTCPSCGDEFVEHVVECPDCRVPLRAAGDSAADAAPIPEPAANAQIERAVLLRHGDTSELRQLAEALTAASIPCAVDTDPPGETLPGGRQIVRGGAPGNAARLAVYVDADDARDASAVLAEWLALSIPGAEHANATSADGGCPGCGDPLPDNAVACLSCGLEFPPLEVACPQCGQSVAVEAESCSHCGHRP